VLLLTLRISFNLGADVAAMAAAMQLLVGGKSCSCMRSFSEWLPSCCRFTSRAVFTFGISNG
jgi:hypothetical protein